MKCVIPARGGSKRIPRKNIRDFMGRPIISYPIRAALFSNLFDKVVVSTDDAEMGHIAQKYGAKLHWRSEKNSSDHAMLADVLLEVLDSEPCDKVCLLLPCTPLVHQSILIQAGKMLRDHNAVVPVVRYSQPYQRALVTTDDQVSMLDPSMYNVRSQDLKPVYYDPGCFWFLDVEAFREYRMLYPPDSVPFELDEMETQDVDTEEDWRLLEVKWQARRS